MSWLSTVTVKTTKQSSLLSYNQYLCGEMLKTIQVKIVHSKLYWYISDPLLNFRSFCWRERKPRNSVKKRVDKSKIQSIHIWPGKGHHLLHFSRGGAKQLYNWPYTWVPTEICHCGLAAKGQKKSSVDTHVGCGLCGMHWPSTRPTWLRETQRRWWGPCRASLRSSSVAESALGILDRL